jgi:hypothetical protein
MKKLALLVLTFIVLFSSGCKDMVDFYLGVPFQPAIDKNAFVPGLNIFGIIRPDSTMGYNNSYIMLQKALPATGSEDSLDLNTAIVKIFHGNKSADNLVCYFLPSNYNGTFEDEYYRPQCDFSPQAGDTILVECSYLELPVLKGLTIVPNKPELLQNTILITENSVSFDVKQDSSIYIFDIYLFNGNRIINYLRIPASSASDTHIKLSWQGADADSLVIYGYDYNFSKYYLTSNTSLNFNKYRETYSTVEDGYGVFGSLNLAGYKLKKPL